MGNNNFIADVVSTCVANSIAFKMFPKKSHQGCGGWFLDTELIVCTNTPDWLQSLVHEASHLDQFLEKDSVWHHPHLAINHWDIVEHVLHPKKWKWAWKITCVLEIDCDSRAVDKINKYRLTDINISEYIREANCYHASYYYFNKYKCFSHKDHNPFDIPEIIELFPDDRILSIDEAWKENKLLGEFIKKYNKPL